MLFVSVVKEIDGGVQIISDIEQFDDLTEAQEFLKNYKEPVDGELVIIRR